MFEAKPLSRLGLALSLPLVAAESKQEKSKQETKNPIRMVKPSQLPLYKEPQDLYSYEYHGKEKTKLEDGISLVRKELELAYEATADTRETARNFYETGKAHSLATADYVLSEENVAAKVGAITVGGLLGLLIWGRKKGLFKKIFYTSVGVTGAAAIVYPKETAKVCQEIYDNAGDYSLIAYNFIAGVKPQSETKSPPSSDPQKKTPPQVAAPPAAKTMPHEVSNAFQMNDDTFKSLLRQSSDVTLWGFRLFDRKEVSKTPSRGYESIREHTGSAGHWSIATDPLAGGTGQIPDLKQRPEESEYPIQVSSSREKTEGNKDSVQGKSIRNVNTKGILITAPSSIQGTPNAHQSVAAVDSSEELKGLPPDPGVFFPQQVRNDPDLEKPSDGKMITKQKQDLAEEVSVKRSIFPEANETEESRPLKSSNKSTTGEDIDSETPVGGLTSKVEEMLKDVVEEVSSSIVTDVAVVVEKEADQLSEDAKTVVGMSEKAEKVLTAVEMVAKAAEETEGISPRVQQKAEAVDAVAKKLKAATSAAEMVASEVVVVADVVSEVSRTVRTSAVEFGERKEKEIEKDVEEIIEDDDEVKGDKYLLTEKKPPIMSFINRFVYYFKSENENASKSQLLETDSKPIESSSKLFDSHSNSKISDFNFKSDESDSKPSESTPKLEGTQSESQTFVPVPEKDLHRTNQIEDIAVTEEENPSKETTRQVGDGLSSKSKSVHSVSNLKECDSKPIHGNFKEIGFDSKSADSTSNLVYSVSKPNESVSESEGTQPKSQTFVRVPAKDPHRVSQIEDFADTLIDSVLNLKIVDITEEEGPLKETTPRVKDKQVVAGESNLEYVGVSDHECEPSSNDAKAETTYTSGLFASLKEKLRESFPKSKKGNEKEEEEEEKDIDEMGKVAGGEAVIDSAKEITTTRIEDDLMVVEAPGRQVPLMPDDFEKPRIKKESPVTSSNKPTTKDVVGTLLSKSPTVPTEGDVGQSNPEDKDMYTTRS